MMRLQEDLSLIAQHFSEISDEQLKKNLIEAGYCHDCGTKYDAIKDLMEALKNLVVAYKIITPYRHAELREAEEALAKYKTPSA